MRWPDHVPFPRFQHEALQGIHDMLARASAAKGHRLARAAILPDHLHVLMGCEPGESPEEVVLSYMNNLAYACGMAPLFQASYFVGTVGEYDLGAVVQKPDTAEASSAGNLARDAAGL